METLGKASFRFIYNSKDISRDLVAYLLSIKYTDNSEGKADELSISLENVDALWENDWYPVKGDTIECEIGYEALVSCGKFEVDEIEIASPPDTVTIKSVAALITGSLRTAKSKAHENTTLKEIVNQVASENGLKVTGEIGNIQFTRITQNKEHDLEFLRRLSKQFGYYFSIRGDQLVFIETLGIISASSVRTIDRSDCTSYNIKDKSAKVFRNAIVQYKSPKQTKVITYSVGLVTQYKPDGTAYQELAPLSVYVDNIKKKNRHKAFLKKYPNAPAGYEDYYESMTIPEYIRKVNAENMENAGSGIPEPDPGMAMDESPTEDDLVINERVENDGQAEAIGKAALVEANTNQQEGSLSKEGDPVLMAGSNFQWTGIGKLSGKYHIVTSDHDISKSGYTTSLEVKRVGFIDLVKGKRKSTTKKKNYEVKVVK